jgi:hypothetical protein
MNTKFLISIAASLGFALCSFSTLSAANRTQKRNGESEIRYVDPERTYVERFSNVETGGNGLLVGAPLASKQSLGTHPEVLMSDLHDCSDEMYRCVYGQYRVFAVPRGLLMENSTYVSGGASFRVEKCFRSADGRCQVALISSDCQSEIAPDKCAIVSGGRPQSRSAGRVAYFIFNEDFGITSFGSVASPAESQEAQLAAALDFILSGDIGLLYRTAGNGGN